MKEEVSHALSNVCMHEAGTLREALVVLGLGAGVVVVRDSDGRLAGLLTDGDVRRALLAGATLTDSIAPFVSRKVTTVSPDASRAEVLDLMRARWIDEIPIVDEKGCVQGLHLLHEVLGTVNRPNWAVIMAGGRGTRLGDLTKSVPKPMLKVAGKPILERLLLHFVGFGIRNIFLSVHFLSEVIEEHFGDGSRFGCKIHYLREKEPLGTGGALGLLPSVPEHPVLVCNGDLVTQADVGEMLKFHVSQGFSMTTAVLNYSHEIPFGCVKIEGNRIVSLQEKPSIVQAINAGIYVVAPELIRSVPNRFFPITELIESCLSNGGPVGAWHIDGEWIDVGRRDELARARNGMM